MKRFKLKWQAETNCKHFILTIYVDLRHQTAIRHSECVPNTALASCWGQKGLQRLESLSDPVARPGRLLIRVRGVSDHH